VIDGDRFIHEQLAARLAPGETIFHTAYLESMPSSGVVGNLRRKGYWLALTAERLWLIETRVGAFKALTENHGVEAIERAHIQGVHATASSLTIALVGGRTIALAGSRKPKYTTRQASFFDELAMRHGGTPVAAELGRSQKKQAILGAVAALVIGGIYVGYQMYWGRAEVSVQCETAEGEVRCTATHTSGGASTEACWEVVLACKNGARSRAPSCTKVDKGASAKTTLTESAFSWRTECDQVSGLTVENMKLD